MRIKTFIINEQNPIPKSKEMDGFLKDTQHSKQKEGVYNLSYKGTTCEGYANLILGAIWFNIIPVYGVDNIGNGPGKSVSMKFKID